MILSALFFFVGVGGARRAQTQQGVFVEARGSYGGQETDLAHATPVVDHEGLDFFVVGLPGVGRRQAAGN